MTKGEFVFGAADARTEFLFAEILAATTRAHIALSTTEKDKKQRNYQEARKAYDTVLHFLPQTLLPQEIKEQISSKLVDLESLLRAVKDGL